MPSQFTFKSALQKVGWIAFGFCLILAFAYSDSFIGQILQGGLIALGFMLLLRKAFIDGLTGLLFPSRSNSENIPILGPAYQARNDNNLGVAIALLLQACRDFPNQATSFIDLMDIYAREYRDYEQVNIVYLWGRNKIRSEMEMKKLKSAFAVYQDLLQKGIDIPPKR